MLTCRDAYDHAQERLVTLLPERTIQLPTVWFSLILGARNMTSNQAPNTGDIEAQKPPWKQIGYRGFCKFHVSDDDFFILRRFGELTSRVLLAMQDELAEREDELNALEAHLSSASARDIHNGSFRQEQSRERLALIHAIDQKLRSYNELVLQHSDLRKRPSVPRKDRTSLANWFSNNPDAILPEETEFIGHARDLFAMVPKVKTPLRCALERSSRFRLFRLWKIPPPIEDRNIHYASDQRIDMFVNTIIAMVGLIMLIVPLWVLAFVTWVVHRLAIITSFVVVFLCFVSFTTVARPFETLGAAAA